MLPATKTQKRIEIQKIKLRVKQSGDLVAHFVVDLYTPTTIEINIPKIAVAS